MKRLSSHSTLRVNSRTRSAMQFTLAPTGRHALSTRSLAPSRASPKLRKKPRKLGNNRSGFLTRRAFTDQPAQLDVEDPKVSRSASIVSLSTLLSASATASYARADAAAGSAKADERGSSTDAGQGVCRKGRKAEGELACLQQIPAILHACCGCNVHATSMSSPAAVQCA